MHDAGLDLVDVEQRVQHARHRAQRLVEPREQLLLPLAFHRLGQQSLQQGQRLQRLAQIVAGGGEEARFRHVGQLRLLLGRPPARRDVDLRSVMSVKVMTTPSTPLSCVR